MDVTIFLDALSFQCTETHEREEAKFACSYTDEERCSLSADIHQLMTFGKTCE